ncbi:MAG TPA: family 20 glycosylhydrolase [Phycisphaerae bacterium]|nr:family 20 glycosylhydrolase [Phycisphaerae bacterium]
MARRGAKGWEVRGIMVDPARLVERHEFYFDLLEHMAAWGLNTLWWHFDDDEGFMLELEGHPELASPHAFTRDEMKRLIEKAAGLGIDVVPEVESLGHARCITSLPQYAELADGGEFGFNAICPSHPRTLPLLAEIITEVAALFPSRYFHAGMDEVDLGDCPRCAARAAGQPAWWIYAEHAKAIHQIVAGAGKEMILWADHVEKAPEMLEELPREIIMAHWHYTDIRPDAIRRSLKAGFRVIGCPALCHWGDVIMPNAGNFANMAAMATELDRLRPADRVLGVANTWWTCWRGLRDAYLPAVAYTGELLEARRAVETDGFFRRYLTQTFGFSELGAAGAVAVLHAAMCTRDELRAALFDSADQMHRALSLSAEPHFARRAAAINSAVAILAGRAEGVQANRRQYQALILAGEVADVCFRRVSLLAQAFEEYSRAAHWHVDGAPSERVGEPLGKAAKILRQMHAETGEVARAVAAEWDRTRYADDPRKHFGPPLWRRWDALLVRLDRAVAFSEKLAADLGRGIDEYARTGRLPGGL